MKISSARVASSPSITDLKARWWKWSSEEIEVFMTFGRVFIDADDTATELEEGE